jgi:hypothetical protein
MATDRASPEVMNWESTVEKHWARLMESFEVKPEENCEVYCEATLQECFLANQTVKIW